MHHRHALQSCATQCKTPPRGISFHSSQHTSTTTTTSPKYAHNITNMHIICVNYISIQHKHRLLSVPSARACASLLLSSSTALPPTGEVTAVSAVVVVSLVVSEMCAGFHASERDLALSPRDIPVGEFNAEEQPSGGTICCSVLFKYHTRS